MMPPPQLVGPSPGDPAPRLPFADGGLSSALPPDLLEQVRGRIRLLAALLAVAFAVDPFFYLVRLGMLRSSGQPAPTDVVARGPFQPVYLAAALASFLLWWVARNPRISPSRLHWLGLVYQVVICAVIALTSTAEYYRSYHMLPSLDWVPVVVIIFPLLLPGPPRRMLAAAIIAGAMSPLAILVLDRSGLVVASGDALLGAGLHSAFAAGLAYLGARVIYGLGREVVRARELGSYRLGDLLGRGGMGEVYRATHRMLARPAAIKLIRPEMLADAAGGAEMAIHRFRQEAEVAASLRSPHTVELYDFGVTADRTFYFVMELLDGMDLETLVRRMGPVPANRVIHILRQVCESLEEAHARGLVHRDIKPANIHIGRLGLRHDVVKVLDFGLVKPMRQEHAAPALATASGHVAGTPAYMAPEMALGEAYDGRADLYALGCVAYYLLTGQMVFEAGNGLQMIARHLRDTPVPPSARSELPLPAALEQLVLSCLAKEPAARPRDVATFSGSLAAIAAEPWGETEARHWWATHQPA